MPSPECCVWAASARMRAGRAGTRSRLASAGNAVLVVEHDLDVVRAADRVLDLGPGAGAHGGRLVFEGTPAELRRDPAIGQRFLGV